MTFKVGRIDFINTTPVYYGIDKRKVDCPGIEVKGPPATLNRMLQSGEIQISSVSSVAYAQNFPRWLILPDLSISANGPVLSVLLCFRKPIDEYRSVTVGLSDKSDSSKALTKIILEEFYNLKPVYKETNLSEGLPRDLDGILVIGDDAFNLNWKEFFPYTIDLGEFWVNKTGSPFVFGLWAVNRNFAQEHPDKTASVVAALHQSVSLGKSNIRDAAGLAAHRTNMSHDNCQEYLENIEYGLTDGHIAGLIRFFDLLKRRGDLDNRVRCIFWDRSEGEVIHD